MEVATNSHMSLDRRRFVAGATALGLSTTLGPLPAEAQDAPIKGGTLRLGMEGGTAADTLDPFSYPDSIPLAYAAMFWNYLIEIDNEGNVTPELAESWEAMPGAAEWIFNIRTGVTFSFGKVLDADDVIFSINLHRGHSRSPLRGLLASVRDITKMSAHQIRIVLNSGNADLPYLLADYHLVIVPGGTTDFAKADGTGAYTLEEWRPGTRIVAKRKNGEYWKPRRGNFDAVELNYINDTSVRTRSLLSGQVDAINRVDPRTIGLLSRTASIKVVRTQGAGNRFAFIALTDKGPFRNRDLMLALKFGIDRQKIIDRVFLGHAIPGNDHLISPRQKYYDPAQIQRPYDPDQARFHIKKSGYGGSLELFVSEGAFTGATDCAMLFKESLRTVDVNLDVRRVTGDGYWDNVWRKVPFCAVYWGSRPTVDSHLSSTFLSTSGWNDTRYANPRFDQLVLDARTELDEAKRREMYAQCQALLSEEAGMVCFAIQDHLDAASSRLRGLEPHARYAMNDMRLAEKGWFA